MECAEGYDIHRHHPVCCRGFEILMLYLKMAPSCRNVLEWSDCSVWCC